ncbi:hypothetical protein AGABI1DRAFT_131957 [Agaricus bisporus var. burnettii JB137-S8]|uniref:Uncharacterized protein n=1 Tax=Agaricus bisporus var. burnettii (strain JB137-S8 / ATCC MYA-4627 / FGSC 10392) TaxID=597362 RepID=K5WKB0_AGABU|nr:uncharacterized protein AGABI1DRAFT_131957 [Agaricus bisporus var. burnettii JB137-S8]EKM75726.1 hypothetical protein AGABI1DRAFT_131957 [Agaricus bisporus var. burnettii JB137-S8]
MGAVPGPLGHHGVVHATWPPSWRPWASAALSGGPLGRQGDVLGALVVVGVVWGSLGAVGGFLRAVGAVPGPLGRQGIVLWLLWASVASSGGLCAPWPSWPLS